jgi:pilus assembly protein CpaB
MARKLIGVIAALALAAVGTAALLVYVQGAERRALAGEETVPVFVVREAINRGTQGTDIGGRVERQLVPAKVQALGSVDELSALQGKVAAVDLVPGEQLVLQRFVAPQELRAVQVPDGLLQVTVSLEPQRALGGMLSAGDLVGVVASFTGSGSDGEDAEPSQSGPTTHLVLHKVLVSNVQASAGSGLGIGGGGDQADPATTAPSGDLLITLAVNAGAAERVVFAAEHGSLWLTAEPDGAPEDGTRIQTMDSIYR